MMDCRGECAVVHAPVIEAAQWLAARRHGSKLISQAQYSSLSVKNASETSGERGW
jgi:hypothetical protein